MEITLSLLFHLSYFTLSSLTHKTTLHKIPCRKGNVSFLTGQWEYFLLVDFLPCLNLFLSLYIPDNLIHNIHLRASNPLHPYTSSIPYSTYYSSIFHWSGALQIQAREDWRLKIQPWVLSNSFMSSTFIDFYYLSMSS